MSKSQKKKSNAPASAAGNDSRFASFETNPRYRLPSSSRVKTKIDKRFQRVFEDEEFTASAKLDKYGRKLKPDNKKKALLGIYQPEEEDEVDEDDIVRKELDKADANYDPARGGGFSSSESESESEDDEEEDDEDQNDEAETDVSKKASMQRLRDEEADVEVGEITKRIAVVNLDWDNIKAVDLMTLFSSFVPQGGRIEKVSIYPSEFGKERMKREEVEGPPKEIFKKAAQDESEPDWEDSEDDSEDEDEKIKKDLLQEGDDQDFDSDALRSYQLDRLRYFYAVVICSDTATAEKIYSACDGTEYLASSNFVDLRFIPDDVTFDDEPREECDSTVANYEPTEFVTDALQHSKVKLTWDINPDDAARKENIRKAFTGSRADLEENDFRAYLASDSEDEDDLEDEVEVVDANAEVEEVLEDAPKLTKKELKAKKLREALGLGSEPMAKSSRNIGPVGDMQVTFTAALMGDDKKKEPEKEETTVEKYIRKERERKAAKKEKAVSKRTGVSAEPGDESAETKEDLGFDDPFFTTDEPVKMTKSAERKEERRKRREEKEAAAAVDAAEKAKLEKIMADNNKDKVEHLDHFNMEEIEKAEKKKAKKYKKKGKDKVEDHGGLQEGFDMDVDDDRFKAVFDTHEFAIDPSNPKFKSTPGMKKLLEEGRKKRKNKSGDFDAPPEETGKAKKQKIKGANDDISSLVESIRQKAQKKR